MTDPIAPSRPNRRTFLQTTSAAAIASGVAGGLSIAQSAHAGATSELIRVGLIGCGGRGTGATKEALSTKGEVKLVAMGDVFADRLEGSLHSLQRHESLSGRIDVPPERRFVGFDAYKQVLNAGVDLVILATPPGFRPIHFAAAIEAGKHVFMEKPVAVDAPGVRAVLAAGEQARSKGLAVVVGLQRRHQNSYRETIARLQNGAIGDILLTRAYWNSAGVWVHPRKPGQTEMEYQMRNWYYFNWLCGDHIVEQHIHNLDVINWLKGGYPVKCQGTGGRQVRVGEEYGEIFDHHAVEYEYADGSRLYSYCRHIPNCWDSVSEHAHGTLGYADISAGVITLKSGEVWRYNGPGNDPYQTEHDDLFASIRNGMPLNEAEYGALSSLTAIMGRMATYSGQQITWTEAMESKLSLAPKEYSWDVTPPQPRVATPGFTEVL